jgi:hypothetical protein
MMLLRRLPKPLNKYKEISQDQRSSLFLTSYKNQGGKHHMKVRPKLSPKDQAAFDKIRTDFDGGVDSLVEYCKKVNVEKTPEGFNEALDMLLEHVLTTIHKMDSFMVYLEDQCDEEALG